MPPIPTTAELLRQLEQARVPPLARHLRQLHDRADLVPALAQVLSDGTDPECTRALALVALNTSDRGPTQTGPVVAASLDDPSAHVRAVAAASLRRIGWLGASAALAGACADREPRVRLEALHALWTLDPPRAVAAADALLGDSDADGLETVLAVLGRVYPERLPPSLHTVSGHPDPEVRCRILTALGTSREPVDGVLASLEDPDASVRRVAVSALMRRRATPPAPALATLLADRDAAVRRLGWHLVVATRPPPDAQWLASIPDAPVAEVAPVLAALGGSDAVARLQALRRDAQTVGDHRGWWQAVAIVGQVAGPMSVRPFLSSLDDGLGHEAAVVRRAAAMAVAVPAAAEALRAHLGREDDPVARAATLTSLWLADPDAADSLLAEALKDDAPPVRIAALRRLAQTAGLIGNPALEQFRPRSAVEEMLMLAARWAGASTAPPSPNDPLRALADPSGEGASFTRWRSPEDDGQAWFAASGLARWEPAHGAVAGQDMRHHLTALPPDRLQWGDRVVSVSLRPRREHGPVWSTDTWQATLTPDPWSDAARRSLIAIPDAS